MIRPIWYLSPDEMGGSGAAEAGSDTAQNQATTNDATATSDDSGNGSSAETQNTDINQPGNESGAKNKGSSFVPYDRFHEVNSKYREETAARARVEAELSFLKEQMAASKQAPAEQVDPELKRTIDYYKPLLVGKDIEKTNQRIEKLEQDLKARDESQKLEDIVSATNEKYKEAKDIPFVKNLYSNEYILNPKSNVDEMGKALNDYLTARDKRVISEYVKGKQTASQHKGASPSGSGPANKPAPLPKNASFNDLMKQARDKATARLENADI